MLQAQESREIYAHMESEHGGPGVNMHDLLAEMENDPIIRDFIERQHPDNLVLNYLYFTKDVDSDKGTSA